MTYEEANLECRLGVASHIVRSGEPTTRLASIGGVCVLISVLFGSFMGIERFGMDGDSANIKIARCHERRAPSDP